MNGKRLAFIYADNQKTEDFYELNNGLFESFKYLPKNIQPRVFVKTDQMNVLQRDSFDIYFRNTYKALEYAVKDVFEPTHTFIIGNSNSPIENMPINPKRPKFLIQKGRGHDSSFAKLFDRVIVEIPEDIEYYSNAIYKAVVNTNSFFIRNSPKTITVCYPQKLSTDQEFALHNETRLWGSLSSNIENDFSIPMNSTTLRSYIFNHSMAVVLLSEEDAVETALSAMACNIPVVVTRDIKASYVPGVLLSNASKSELIATTQKAMNMKYNFRDAYITPNFNPKSYADMLVDITK